jgi:hypothetical protein
MRSEAPTRQAYTRKPDLSEVKAASHDVLRTVNRRILLNILSERQPISRADIAKISGLNKATVSTITGELLRENFIVEEGLGRTTPIGGKPPTPLRINELRYGLFGVDVRADDRPRPARLPPRDRGGDHAPAGRAPAVRRDRRRRRQPPRPRR